MATFTEMLFYEYFHADNATGLGASHQTDSTGIIAKIDPDVGRDRKTRRCRPGTAQTGAETGFPNQAMILAVPTTSTAKTGLGCISQSACATMRAAPKLANFHL